MAWPGSSASPPPAGTSSASPSPSWTGLCCTRISLSQPATQLEALKDWDGAVAMLEECLVRTRQSKADDLMPLIDFRLGCAYEKANSFVKAVEVGAWLSVNVAHLWCSIWSALSTRRRTSSRVPRRARRCRVATSNLVNGCFIRHRLIAISGDVEAAIAFLVQLVSNGLKSGQLAIAASASSSLGSIYDSKGDHVKAVDCFKQAFELQLRTGSLQDVAEARVKYGIAAARIAATHFSSSVLFPGSMNA